MSIHTFETTVQDTINMYAAVPADPSGELYFVPGIGVDFDATASRMARALAGATNRGVVVLDLIGDGQRSNNEQPFDIDGMGIDPITAGRSEMLVQTVEADIPQEFRERGVRLGRNQGPISYLGHCAGSSIVIAAASDIAGDNKPDSVVLAEPMGMHPKLTNYGDTADQFIAVRKLGRLQNRLNNPGLSDQERAKLQAEQDELEQVLPERFLGVNVKRNVLDPTAQVKAKKSGGESKADYQARTGDELNRALIFPVAHFASRAALNGVKVTFLTDRYDLLAPEEYVAEAVHAMTAERPDLPVVHIRYGRDGDVAANGRPPYGHGHFTRTPRRSARVVNQALHVA